MRIQAFTFVALCVSSSLAIFVDEVNDIDFHHALLGVPSPQSTFFHRPSSSSNASLLYTLSDRLVLGAVNPKDGSLVWRQDRHSSEVRWAVGEGQVGVQRRKVPLIEISRPLWTFLMCLLLCL